MKIVYSLIKEEDVGGIYNISKDSFSIPWSLNSIKSEVSNPLAKYVVAMDIDLNIVVGFVGIWIVAGEGDITNIAVHKDYRRLGMGMGRRPAGDSRLFALCAKHGTNLAGESPATGFYRQV